MGFAQIIVFTKTKIHKNTKACFNKPTDFEAGSATSQTDKRVKNETDE